MKRLLTLVCCILFLTNVAHAQILLTGAVNLSDGEPCPGVIVTLRTVPDSAIVAYGYTDRQGLYSIKYSGRQQSLLLTASGMLIKSVSKTISSVSQTVNFVAEENVQYLKEVIIKNQRIWAKADTVNYLVSSFSGQNDVVIGDILKKMPGISVSEQGQIAYMGRPINKFYIEGLDLLGGRYGIATKNIPSKSVSVVQVLENHQPIKAIREIVKSNEAAINLKLKEDAKGRMELAALLGIGATPLLWNAELTALYFGKNKQNISSYKANNAGLDLSIELKDYLYRELFKTNDVMYISMPTAPGISRRRYLFNNSHAVSFNHLNKINDNKQIRVNISYLNDHERRDSENRTDYYLPDGTLLTVDENLHSTTNTNLVNAGTTYTNNGSERYVQNALNVSWKQINDVGSVFYKETLHQRKEAPTVVVTNNLNLLKTNNAKTREFMSNFGFKSSPQTMMLTPGPYCDLFNQGIEYKQLIQKARTNDFYFDNTLQIVDWRIGKLKIDHSVLVNLRGQTLTTDLHTVHNDIYITLNADSLRNNINQFALYATLFSGIHYTVGNLNMHAKLFLGMENNYINNKSRHKYYNHLRMLYPLELQATYAFNTDMKLIATSSFSDRVGNIGTLYTGYIMENYRNLNHYDNRLSHSYNGQAGLRFQYKNAFDQFFVNAGINYQQMSQNMMFAQSFKGILMLTSSLPIQHNAHNANVTAKVSKGFDVMGITTNLEGTYGIYSGQQLREDELIGYHNKGLTLTASLEAMPTHWFNLNYMGVFNRSSSTTNKGDIFTPIRTFRNTAKGIFIPLKNFSVNVTYEHYYNSGGIGNRYLSFTDLSAVYNYNTYVFSLSWSNILNTKKYVTATYNNINSFNYTYHIRGSELMLSVRMKIK
jgi:hypothetical protein